MSKDTEVTKSHCNLCGRDTKHIVLATRVVVTTEEEDYGPLRWEDTYELLECAGCESVSMRHTNWFVQADATEVSLYPPPVKRRRPHWFNDIPRPVRTLFQQVYQALDSNSRSLALMGARAVLDMVLVEVAGDERSFSAKLDELEKKGFIGSKNKEVLSVALDAGNAASHRGYMPSPNDMNAVMDIVENLLQSIYHLKSLAESLKKTTPVRSESKC